MNSPREPSSQRCIKSVGNQVDGSVREPIHDVEQHVLHQVKHRLPNLFAGAFPVKTHIDWQSQRFASPGRFDFKAQQDNLQTPCVDNFFGGGSNRISTGFGTDNLSPGLFVNGIVANKPKDDWMPKNANNDFGQCLEKSRSRPSPDSEPPMVGVMRVTPFGISKLKNRGYNPSAWTKNPALENILQQFPAGCGKNCVKRLYKLPQLRYSYHGRSSSVKLRLPSHLHCSRRTALSGTGSC